MFKSLVAIATFSATALFSVLAYAQISNNAQMYDAEHPKVNKPVRSVVGLNNAVVVSASTMCIGGYLFAVATQDNKTTSAGSAGISLVQIFQANKASFPPQPIPCVEGK